MYGTHVAAGSTVLDTMKTLAAEGDFTFTGRDYPSLGFFVESINEKRQSDGYVWIFYVNGVKSSIGITSLTLKPGDTIEWKYEKKY